MVIPTLHLPGIGPIILLITPTVGTIHGIGDGAVDGIVPIGVGAQVGHGAGTGALAHHGLGAGAQAGVGGQVGGGIIPEVAGTRNDRSMDNIVLTEDIPITQDRIGPEILALEETSHPEAGIRVVHMHLHMGLIIFMEEVQPITTALIAAQQPAQHQIE